jgi:hypothetical protein
MTIALRWKTFEEIFGVTLLGALADSSTHKSERPVCGPVADCDCVDLVVHLALFRMTSRLRAGAFTWRSLRHQIQRIRND